jgi:CRISPR system Cascade subunit CasE
MYLSLLQLNPHSRQVQSELANPYEMHRTVMQAFPDGHKRDAAGVLFRLDFDARTGQPALLVQSKIEPNWHMLKVPYLLPGCDPNPQVKELQLRLQAGQLLAFRLCANPTKRLGAGGDKGYGTRVALHREEDQYDWLARKAAANGFRVLQAQVSHTDTLTGKLHRDVQTTHTLTFYKARFDGVLEVTDPVLLRDAVSNGIGSGKAFGFGLLSLARPQ